MIIGTITSSFKSAYYEADVDFYVPLESKILLHAISRNKRLKPATAMSVGISTEKFLPISQSPVDDRITNHKSVLPINNFGTENNRVALPDATKNKDLSRFMRNK